jgi:hypothetical protein
LILAQLFNQATTLLPRRDSEKGWLARSGRDLRHREALTRRSAANQFTLSRIVKTVFVNLTMRRLETTGGKNVQ